MKKKDISIEIETIKKDIYDIKTTISEILSRFEPKTALPLAADAPNPMGKKRHISHRLIGGFRDPNIREMIVDLRKQGKKFSDIEIAIKDAYPDAPEKHVSRSAIHRFCESARRGRLIEYGIGKTL